MIKAVLFDCDGLMFETERISVMLWRQEAKRYGIDLPDDFFVHIIGAGKEECQAYMASEPGLCALRDHVAGKRFDLQFWGGCAKDTLNKRGLVELYAYLHDHGYLIGICSSSSQAYVLTLLSTVSKKLSYDVLVTGDMVTHAKPDPEIFLAGAQRLHVHPEECLVLEDSKVGIMAAHAAGMHSCWIKDMIDEDEEMTSCIEYRCYDLFGVMQLLEELNGGNNEIQ